MILIISTCKEKLSEYEFVNPIKNIVERYDSYDVITYKEVDEKKVKKYDKVIITGTALKDYDYMNYLNNFSWLKNFNKPVFGICAGLQIISLVFDSKLKNKKIIGVKNVEIIKENKLTEKNSIRAYFVTSRVPEISNSMDPIGFSNGDLVFFKIKEKEIYATSFHPEVMNEGILTRFLKLV